MSQVTEHALSASNHAFTLIGRETVVIDNNSISCILSEIDESKSFTEIGFEPSKKLSAVCKTSDLPSTTLLKKLVVVRSQTFRVEGLRSGASFTKIDLEEVTKA